MSKIADIMYRIDQLDGGSFQRLCDLYLSCEGYRNVYSLGMTPGTNKTAKGNPDTYFLNADDKYIFVMYTTQKKGFMEKAKEDIDKCLNPVLTGVPASDIVEIIYCHTQNRVSPGDDKELRQYAATRGITIKLIGLDLLSTDIYIKYPFIARDCLDLPVDTGQIKPVAMFVDEYDSNKLAAPLKIPFQYREKERDDALAALETNDVIILSGAAGVGKTRLAIEVCEALSKDPLLSIFCIKNNNLEIYSDLNHSINLSKNYVLFVDDANELGGLKHVLQYLSVANREKDFSCKIIMTVREYAKETVLSQVLEYTKPYIIRVSRFSDEQIRGLLEAVYGITNSLYTKQIERIAEGNARLAILAGRLAKEKRSLDAINDASVLYENYYKRQLSNIIKSSETELRSAGIIAFLQAIRLDDLSSIDPLLAAANVSSVQFVEDIKHLHELELVDICRDRAVRLVDQSFGNFLIKYVFVDKALIPLSEVIEHGFFVSKTKTLYACSTLWNVFADDSTSRMVDTSICVVWDKLQTNAEKFHSFFKAFHFVRPTETLLNIKEIIDSEVLHENSVEICEHLNKNNSESITDDIISILCDYASSENYLDALDLLLYYYQKRPDRIGQIYAAYSKAFGMKSISYHYSYSVQASVVEHFLNKLKEKPTRNMYALFVLIAAYYLKNEFSSAESSRSGNSVTFYTFGLIETPQIVELRSRVWNTLLEMYKACMFQREIELILFRYGKHRQAEIDKGIIQKEYPIILKLIGLLDPNRLSHCLVVRKLNRVASECDIGLDSTVERFLKSDKSIIVYALQSFVPEDAGLDYSERELRFENRVRSLLRDNIRGQYELIMDVCAECQRLPEDMKANLELGIQKCFCVLDDKKDDLFQIASSYLKQDTPFDISPYSIVRKLLSKYSAEEVYKLVNENEYTQKDSWLWSFFAELPPDQVSREWHEKQKKNL